MLGTTFSPAGLTITITPTADLIAQESTIEAAMVAQIAPGTSYSPQNGPSAGTPLNAASWAYYWVSSDGTESDWAAVAGTSVPSFTSFTAATAQSVMLPDTQVVSGRVYFGMPSLPVIAVASSVPQSVLSTSDSGVYDFVEFSYVADAVTYADTTMIDQFGIPMQIELVPLSSSTPAPPAAGVYLDRTGVISQFQTNVVAAFQTGLQNICGQPVAPPPLRILSPNDVLVYSCVQGVTASVPAGGGSSTLAAGTYAYAVSAVDANGNEGYVQATLAPITIAANQQVTIGWAPLASQPYGGAGIASFNVYRYDSTAGTWTLLNFSPPLTSSSTAAQDTGQAGTVQTPNFNPLASWFDGAIGSFFDYYQSNILILIVPNVSPSGSTWLYSFNGSTVPASGSPQSLQFSFTGAADLTTGDSISSADLPFAAGTPFNVYYPYWSSNTYGTSSVAPPSWTPYPNSPASMMVFAANGVWADNVNQVYDNLPSQVTPPPALPAQLVATSPAGIWSTLLGTLENMVVSALTRGIGAPLQGSLPIAPASWASQPTQTVPTLSSGTSSLQAGTTYYYVITAMNGTGSSATESAPSLEMTAQPVAGSLVVNVNWNPVLTWQATSFNIYRGTVSGEENILVQNVTNDGTVATLADTGQGTSQSPSVSYFPSGSVFNNYVAFFHQTSISYGGGAYASPYDDQSAQSSTIVCAASGLNITLGPWS
ncbi:MAG TPA: beta-1,3-glucanase family protein [Thermoanaerobaculia bacterium]|nr:beta-1,3-glucanase family protein [Thermoanaerobaculia bacterium]